MTLSIIARKLGLPSFGGAGGGSSLFGEGLGGGFSLNGEGNTDKRVNHKMDFDFEFD